ncbi:MAG: hypothetical protein U0168_25400 [Nannocystaceae bacterium]
MDAAVIDAAPRLRVVSNMAVGVDNIDLAACAARGIPVGHTPGVLTDATADLTMALVLSHSAAWSRRPTTRAGCWTPPGRPDGWLGRDLSGATGHRRLGRSAARWRGAPRLLRCLVHSRARRRPHATASSPRARRCCSRAATSSRCTCQYLQQTRHMIDAAALASMRSPRCW